MIPVTLLLLTQGTAPQLDAAASYADYLAQFETSEAIVGAFQHSGGPRSQPDVSVFRVKKGGMYSMLMSDAEEYFDGNSLYRYFPAQNRYKVGVGSHSNFAALFGRRFVPDSTMVITVRSVEDGEWSGTPARIFLLRFDSHANEIELFVRKSDLRPIGLRYRGAQAQYMTLVVQLRTDLSLPDSVFQWTAPKNVKRVD